MMRRVLDFVREQRIAAHDAPASLYRDGYLNALAEVNEFITDEMWEEGEEDEGT